MTSPTSAMQGWIDAAVRRLVPMYQRLDTANGVLVTRDGSGTTGTATIDPGTVSVPVKISGGVNAFENDRVALVRTGGYWTVVGVLAVRGMGEKWIRNLFTGTATTTNGSYEDIPQMEVMTGFRKYYNGTMIRIYGQIGVYATAVSTAIDFAVRVTGTSDVDGSAYDSGDWRIDRQVFNVANKHDKACGWVRMASVPAGTYNVTFRWRRAIGTGTITSDTNDMFNCIADERGVQL